MSRLLLLVSLSVFLLVSCNNDSSVSLQMSFSNTSNGARFARTAAGDPCIGNFSLFEDAYSLLGNQVDFSGSTTLSPSSFILPFTQASLGNGTNEIALNVPLLNYPESEWNSVSNVDFCAPHSYEIQDLIVPDIYNTIFMRLSANHKVLNTYDIEIWETPLLEVTVPGYTDEHWPDIDSGLGFYRRQYLGNNKFRVELELVLPTVKDSNGNIAQIIENYTFCSDYSSPGAVFPGLDGYPDIIDTTEFGYINAGSSTGTSMLLFPFNEVNLTGDTTLVFFVETNDILTVYDNNTTEKNDDKLMLVSDFYTHFGVRAE